MYGMHCLVHSMYTVRSVMLLMAAQDKPTSASSRKSLAPVSSVSNRSSPPIWTIFKGELHSAKSAWASIWEADRSASKSAGRHTHCKTPSQQHMWERMQVRSMFVCVCSSLCYTTRYVWLMTLSSLYTSLNAILLQSTVAER